MSTVRTASAYDDPLAAVAALPGVAAAVDSARAAVDALLGHRVLRRKGPQVAAESALRGARAAAALDAGVVPAPLEELRETLRGGTSLPPAVTGAVRLFAESGTLLQTWQRAPRQALARMHTLGAAGTVAPDDLGRPRRGAAPADPLALSPAPASSEVALRLDGLSRLLMAPTSASAVVVAAVVHGELLTVRAFASANVLVALSAQRLVLVSRGLDAKAVAVPETGHLELGADAYAQAAAGYLTGAPEGVTGWVRHCASAVELGAREGVAVCEAVQRGA